MGESWLVFAIVLTYVGGVLVLFIYLCSLGFSKKIEITSIFIRGVIILRLSFGFYYFRFLKKRQDMSNLISIFRLYTKFDLFIIFLVASYLTFGLLVRMLIVQKNFGPLKWIH